MSIETERRLRADLSVARRKLKRAEKQIEELRSRLERDELTGLFLRTRVEEEIRRIPLKDRRDPDSVQTALVMIDLDHFKSINDQYGHEVGNEVLQSVARVLTDNTRRTDLVFRYGGEEFGILFRNVNPAPHALGVKLEAIRREVESLLIDGHPSLRVSASFGWVVVDPRLVLTENFRRADAALYAAKRAGRNRIIDYLEIEADDISIT